MRKTRSYVLTLTAALAAALATSSPSFVPGLSSSGHVDLAAGPAGVPLALIAASSGRMDRAALQAASARSASAAAVAGAEGATRSIVRIGDVNADGRTDLLDLRASEKTLDVTGVSGRNGSALWTRQFTTPTAIYGAAFSAGIDADGNDAYLLVQSEHEGFLAWTVHAIDGATGVTRWTQAGSVPSGMPTIPPSPPSIPPTIPPVPTPGPTTVPTGAPTAVPTAVPTETPTAIPAPTADPTTVPTAAPTGLPTTLPTSATTAVPTAAPTTAPTAPPTAAPTVVPTAVPTALPTIPSPPPTSGGRSSSASAGAQNETPVLPATLQAFAVGLSPVDVDGDARADLPLVVYEAGIGPDKIPVLAATLVTLTAPSGQSAGVIVAAGRGAVPYVGVAGDMTADGLPDLVAADEIYEPGAATAATTWRAAASNGRPLWTAVDRFEPGSVGVVDATEDVTGDHVADVVAHRLPVGGTAKPSIVLVRTGTSGVEHWRTELPESTVVTVGPRIDSDEAADVVAQSVAGTAPDMIPDEITYRALSGADKREIYVQDHPFPCGGCLGAWTATLVGHAGDLNADGSPDLAHAMTSFPASSAGASSQAGVSARTGTALWTLECLCAPSTPIQANLAAGPGQDLIEAKEIVTRTTDAISLRAASGSDAAPLWQTTVVVGSSNDRIQSLALTPADLTGTGSADVLVTAVQRTGTKLRSVVVAVRGSTGRIIWIRSK